MGPPLVSLRALSKTFGAKTAALAPVTLAARTGEIVSLVGPSGCGKSTLLRLIAGLIPPTSGEISILGKSLADARLEQSIVFQDATLLPWLHVAANVELPQKLRGVSGPERRIVRDQMLQLVHLEEKAYAYPAQLSGGQKMRAALARALAVSPKILLLDEPFGALDEMTRERLNEELLEIKEQQGWTAFFVTHSVAEAVFLSDRILLFTPAPGRIRREFAIDLPHPRTSLTRLTRRYQDLVADVARVLRSSDSHPGFFPGAAQ